MFFRRSPRRRRRSGLGSFADRPRTRWSRSNVDRVLGAKRGYSRRLTLEPLEERHLLAVMTVTSLTDDTLANLAGDGQLSLREAIQAINTGAAVDGIGPTSGVFGTNDEIRFAPAGGTITMADAAGEFALTRSVIITGPGANLLTIDAGNGPDNTFNTGDGYRIFNISDGMAGNVISVTIFGLTLTGGDPGDVGGAIRAQFETLRVRDSVITGNAAFGGASSGGGIYTNPSGSGGVFELTRSTVSRNASGFHSGGVFAVSVGGALDISYSTISENMSASFFGGGISVSNQANGTTTISHSTIHGNSTEGRGGGIDISNQGSATTTITNSTISENRSKQFAGGILLSQTGGTVEIIQSTISGNATDGGGGGLFADVAAGSTLTIRHATITRNISNRDVVGAGSGGGVYLARGTGSVTLDNTIIAGNTDFTNVAPDIDNTTAPTHPTINQTFTLVGNNKGAGAAFPAGALIGTPAAPINPLLGPLANNGGPTRTHALLSGSPAINMGDPAAMAGVGTVPMFDQRGTPFTRVAGGRIDIGAFELVPPPTAPTMMLLPSSDTGMFNNDRVTNKMQPAFGGVGPAGLPVFVFAQRNDAQGMPLGEPFIVGIGTVGSDGSDGIFGNGLGVWQVTVEPMADGKYNFFARFDEPVNGPGGLTEAVADTPRTFTFTGPVNIPDGPNGAAVAPVDVTGMPTFVADVNVTVNIMHPNVGDLMLTLISPSGTAILLSNQRGGTGDNFTNTVFDDSADNSITTIVAAQAPFTGRFRPEQPLSTLFGEPTNGTWRLFVTDTVAGNTGQILNWTLSISSPIMVVIDTVEPNTPFLDLVLTNDTGRHNNDNITKQNMPVVTMTSTDPNVALAQLLFTDNLKFRIYDRFENNAEFLLYDSALDAVADASNTAGDMFTALTFLSKMLPEQFFTQFGGAANPAVIDVGGVGKLADGVHNLKLEVEDRAGNISHDFILQITVDTTSPPVSFGLPDAASTTDGLTSGSDSGVVTMPETFSDRITNVTRPRFWGRAEANSVVRLFFDNPNAGTLGVFDLATDIFLGQTVAVPFDGNDAFPDGYWEITSALDLNQIAGLPQDGLRTLFVTAEDVAGNPMAMNGVIADVATLDIFLDTRGPQVQNVFVTEVPSYDLFDPKPSTNGFTPLVDRITVKFTDLPARLQDFLYSAVKEDLATTIGNYQLVGDHVGNILIREILFNDLTSPGGGGGGPAIGSGGVIIDGGDREEHGFASAGPDTMLGTPDDINMDGWRFIEQMVNFAATTSQNAGTGILVVGASGNALDAITSVATVLGLPIMVATTGGALDLATVNFNDFALMYVPTHSGQTTGGVSSTDLDTLTARKLDVQNFVNAGGSLVALTEDSYATPFSWLELPDPFTIGSPASDTQYQTQALIDAGLMITNAELINGTPLHNTFTGPPGFNGLLPFVFNVGPNGTPEDGGGDDQIVTLGLGQGGFLGGMVMTEVTLVFDRFLPDDRYTLTVRDSIADIAGNSLDGESQAASPFEDDVFPSGDGVPGGNFVARFTIDSRPEIGSYVSTNINIDTNGNFIWDPAGPIVGGDATNFDISWTLPVQNADGSVGAGGFSVNDLLFAGKFVNLAPGAAMPPRLFDQLAAFGFSNGQHRWIIDTNSDGVIRHPGIDVIVAGMDVYRTQPTLANFNVSGAIPVAGRVGLAGSGRDVVGLYNAGKWAFDINQNWRIDANEVFTTSLMGHPIVGDFDGDGLDDLGVFNNNQFSINLAFDGFADATDVTFTWGFPGSVDRPLAADMDQDGIDDIGLFVPRSGASAGQGVGEWYFLLSNDHTGNLRVTGTLNRLNHPFTPVPFGNDIFAEFGNERALPIVGNFDPPVARPASPAGVLPGDYNGSGAVTQSDYNMWKSSFSSTTNLAADGNGNNRVDAADYVMWRKNLGNSASASASSATDEGADAASEPGVAFSVMAAEDSGSYSEDEIAATSIGRSQTGGPLAIDGFFERLDRSLTAARSLTQGRFNLASETRENLLLAVVARLDKNVSDNFATLRPIGESDEDSIDGSLLELAAIDEVFGSL